MNRLKSMLKKLNIGIVLLAVVVTTLVWNADALEVHADEGYQVEEVSGTGSVTADTLKVRTGPGKDYDTAGLVNKGEKINITGEADGWYRIDYEGVKGFVSADYVELVDELVAASSDDKSSDDEADSSDEKDNKSDKKDKKETTEQVGEPEEGYNLSHPNPKWIIVFGVVLVILVMVISIIYTLRKFGDDEEDDDEYDDEYDDAYDEYESDEYDDEYEDDEYDDDEYDDDEYEDDEYGDEYESDEYDDEEYEDDEYDDGEYEDDEYADEYEDDEYADEYEDDEYTDEYDGDEYEEEYENRRNDSRRHVEQSGYVESKEYSGPERRRSNGQAARKEVVIREEDYRVDIDPSFFETTTIIVQPDAVTGYVPGKLDKEEKLNEAMHQLNKLQEEIERLKNED